MLRRTSLKRSGPIKRKTRLSPVSARRRAELAEYRKKRKLFLEFHRVCEVWCAENGFKCDAHGAAYHVSPERQKELGFKGCNGDYLLVNMKAPRATQIHHRNKRRGVMLNDETYWLAVCAKNHARIENDKAWARANGFLLNF